MKFVKNSIFSLFGIMVAFGLMANQAEAQTSTSALTDSLFDRK